MRKLLGKIVKFLLRVIGLTIVSLASSAEAAFLGKLSEHPTMMLTVSSSFETKEGSRLREIELSWTHANGATTYKLTVPTAFIRAGNHPNRVSADVENVPIAEIFELMRAAEASMPAFDAAANGSNDARRTTFELMEGGSSVRWLLEVKPDSKPANAIRKIYDRLFPLLTAEQKEELEKCPRTADPRFANEHGFDLKVGTMEKVEGGLADRSLGLGLSESTGKNGSSSGSSAYILGGAGVRSAEKQKNETAKLAKWPAADLSKILLTYSHDGRLGERAGDPEMDSRSGPMTLDMTNGEGQFISQTYPSASASRIEAWAKMQASMRKLLSPKEVEAMEAHYP